MCVRRAGLWWEPMTKLAVASCAKLQQIDPQPVWSRIRAVLPDGLLLLGDTIYLDDDRHGDAAALGAELRRLYAARLAEPHFAALLADLRERSASVLAIYDDHDFLGDGRYGGHGAGDTLEGTIPGSRVEHDLPCFCGRELGGISGRVPAHARALAGTCRRARGVWRRASKRAVR